MPITETMVRWIEGFYGGLFAGVTCAAFSAIVAVEWLRDLSLEGYFAQAAQALPPFHGAPATWPLAGLGAVLYLLLAAAFGLVYSLAASRIRSMWRAPTSVLWGMGYGVLVWWAVNDVLVPLTGAVIVQPAWQGLAGAVVFYGVILSEITTIAYRRSARTAP